MIKFILISTLAITALMLLSVVLIVIDLCEEQKREKKYK